MKQDFDLIVHKLPKDMTHANIYPLGDLHIGSGEFNHKQWKRWLDMVAEDENGYFVINGDLMNNGVKNSKTNVYGELLRPREQKEWLKQALYPIKDKFLGGTSGNHELRSVNEVDDCPLYDVLAKLDLEDLYRENMAFIKVNVGSRTKDRQVSYNLVLTHGQSRSKTENFAYAIDGLDVFITGHDHQPKSRFPSKIVIDPHNEVVRVVGYTHITVPSFQNYGGYALRGLYLPQDNSKFPIIRLNGMEKEVSVTWM